MFGDFFYTCHFQYLIVEVFINRNVIARNEAIYASNFSHFECCNTDCFVPRNDVAEEIFTKKI